MKYCTDSLNQKLLDEFNFDSYQCSKTPTLHVAQVKRYESSQKQPIIQEISA